MNYSNMMLPGQPQQQQPQLPQYQQVMPTAPAINPQAMGQAVQQGIQTGYGQVPKPQPGLPGQPGAPLSLAPPNPGTPDPSQPDPTQPDPNSMQAKLAQLLMNSAQNQQMNQPNSGYGQG